MPENLERRGDKYYLRIVIGGKLYRRTTGFGPPRLEQARRRANEMEAEIRAGRFGWITTPPPDVPLFDTWAIKFLDAYHPGRTLEKHLLRRARALWLGRKLNEIKRSDAEAYIRERAQTAKKGGVQRERVLLKAMFRAAIDDGLITENPFAKVRSGRPDPKTRVMTPDEEALIRAGLSPKWDRWLTVMLGTGLRRSELLMARPIDVKGDWLHVRPESNKTRTGRTVPLRPEVKVALEEQARLRKGTPSTPFWLGHAHSPGFALRRRCLKLGIPLIGVHDLRRTFASRCANAKPPMPVKVLQSILGHKSPDITLRYYVHASPELILAEIASVEGLLASPATPTAQPSHISEPSDDSSNDA